MRAVALDLLRNAFGADANFRPGQWEAIEALINGKRLLLADKVGSGKSIIYLIASGLLRSQGMGPGLVISPLLSLIWDQLALARRLGVTALSINSENVGQWSEVERALVDGDVDLLLITPERLRDARFGARLLPRIKPGISCLAVDEAHLLSHWGHHFRLDYLRLIKLIKENSELPLICTTSLLDGRVFQEIQDLLAENLDIRSGPLALDNLNIYPQPAADRETRLAWLAKNLPSLPGNGIIFCLTRLDCDQTAEFLRSQGVLAFSYHSAIKNSRHTIANTRQEMEMRLKQREVKALVATSALGLGFDKRDLSFVVHLQSPASLRDYFLQVSGVGHPGNQVYSIILIGNDDADQHQFFLENALPTIGELEAVLQTVADHEGEISLAEIQQGVNLSESKIDSCLKRLEVEQVVLPTMKGHFYRTVNPWIPNGGLLEKLRVEWQTQLAKVDQFLHQQGCYQQYLAKEFGEVTRQACGRCSNCSSQLPFKLETDSKLLAAVNRYLKGKSFVIRPKTSWPPGIREVASCKIPAKQQLQLGRALCGYGGAGWGETVKEDKYRNGFFRRELVVASAKLISRWHREIKWVTWVPSLRRPTLVSSFAKELAQELALPCEEVLVRVLDNLPQRLMDNPYHQCRNVYQAFQVKQDCQNNQPVLLVDDVVGSGWTLTICGSLLRCQGVAKVFPFVLARASYGEV